jgi:hypothetical protein
MTNMRIYGSVILGLLLAVGSYDAIGAERVVRPNELVLGVVVEGKARAYPINMLTGPRREIINDELGGKAIAATW